MYICDIRAVFVGLQLMRFRALLRNFVIVHRARMDDSPAALEYRLRGAKLLSRPNGTDQHLQFRRVTDKS